MTGRRTHIRIPIAGRLITPLGQEYRPRQRRHRPQRRRVPGGGVQLHHVGRGDGLAAGKAVGIVAASAVCVAVGLSRLPAGSSFRQLAGVAVLAGIGFTVSLFIADRSFTGGALYQAKIGILAGSAVSGVLGIGVLVLGARHTLRRGGG